MAVEAYRREDTAVCLMEGKLRYPDGSIEEGRWLIEGTDAGKDDLCIYDAQKNKVKVDLGGCLFKKRLPRAGAGKSGGYRVIVGYKKPNTARLIFLFAFAKNDRANMSAKEEAALSRVAEAFVSASEKKQLQKLLTLKTIKEVHCND